MDDLKGKTAVVTGAASGIGLALARRFVAEGMNVVMADIEQPALDEAAATIDGPVLSLRTDVSKWEEVEALRDRTFDRFGTAHVICNNAGVGAGGLMQELTLDDWKWTLDVNLWGVIHGVTAFLPRLLEQDEGHVVNTSSIGGLGTMAAHGPYCVTKHGIVALSETLAQELEFQRSQVGVTALCPGRIATRIYDGERNRPGGRRAEPNDDARQWFEQGTHPDEVAGMVVDAILANKLWVLTHPELAPLVRMRFDRILAAIQG